MTVLTISNYLLTIQAIRRKRTRCDQSNDGGSVEWRRCATAER